MMDLLWTSQIRVPADLVMLENAFVAMGGLNLESSAMLGQYMTLAVSTVSSLLGAVMTTTVAPHQIVAMGKGIAHQLTSAHLRQHA